MSELAKLPYAQGRARVMQVRFGGVDRREGATDGAIRDMRNLTGENYPILQPRRSRRVLGEIENCGGIYWHEDLLYVSGTELWYAGKLRGHVTAGEKIFCAMGNRIAIWPDKIIFNASYERHWEFATLAQLKAAVTNPEQFEAYGVGSGVPYEIYVWDGGAWVSNGLEVEQIERSVTASSVKFMSGTYEGEDADANTIYSSSVNWSEYFREGDAVTISGCTKHPENNKTPIIREIDGHYLRFYENTFLLDGDKGLTDYTETGAITFERTAPDLDGLCANDNRLFGYKDDTIYASALGDPFNWNKFEGLASDSFFVDAGTPGEFTACVSYLGYPTFFKRERVFKLYGAKPQNFVLQASAFDGVQAGSGKSLAIVNEVLFYLSEDGARQYTGGMPDDISQPLAGLTLRQGVGGSDGRHWYLSAENTQGGQELWLLDTLYGSWWREDGFSARAFCRSPQGLIALEQGTDRLWLLHDEEAPERGVRSWAEFANFTDDTLDRKSVEKIRMRLTLAPRASVAVMIQYDDQSVWNVAAKFDTGDTERSVAVPIMPRRCDRYRIRIEGEGLWKLHVMAREVRAKSERG